MDTHCTWRHRLRSYFLFQLIELALVVPQVLMASFLVVSGAIEVVLGLGKLKRQSTQAQLLDKLFAQAKNFRAFQNLERPEEWAS